MNNELKEVVIVAYGRSAIARAGDKGFLRLQHPVDYAGQVLSGVLKKVPQLDPKEIDDLVVGCAKPEGVQGMNVARIIGIRAGLPFSVPAQTVNRFCSSGLQTISTAANMIKTGEAEVVVAGGLESMTSIPMGGSPQFQNKWILENQPGVYMGMGLTAENVAAKCNVTREEMDKFAVESHNKAEAAQKAGRFKDEIIPVTGNDLEGKEFSFDADQGIRYGSTVEKLSTLKPAFKENGVVTAGQASQVSDGTSFVVLMSKEKAEKLGIKPIAKFLGFAAAGLEPEYMGLGPVYAIPKLLKKLNLSVDKMDVMEINEAFAAQVIPTIKDLNLDTAKVNPNGGAIALGHPLGATGAILTCKVLSELQRVNGKYGLISMCIGGGMGAAAVVEMI